MILSGIMLYKSCTYIAVLHCYAIVCTAWTTMAGLVTDLKKMEKEKEANQEQELKKDTGFFPKLLWILLTFGTLVFMITVR